MAVIQSTLIPIIAIIMSIGGPVAIVIVAIVAAYMRKKRHYEAMVKAMELGKDPEAIGQLFMAKPDTKEDNALGYLKGGIVVAGIGLGLFGMGTALGEIDMYGPSVFMFILGLTLVLVYLVIRPKNKDKSSK